MASKKRKLELRASAKRTETEITFTNFFQSCLMRNLLKPWQEKEVLAFFRHQGLRDKETPDKYLDALARY